MRIPTRLPSLVPATRRYASVSTPMPFRATPVVTPLIWHHLYEREDSRPLQFPAAFAGYQEQGPLWKYRGDASSSTPTMFAVAGEVKGNPTESEADVAADRSDDDPLPPGLHHTIQMPPGEAAPKPTDSEERVTADRSEEDPLGKRKR